MPVYDILANQVLPEPITNYYRGKAIRQDLKLKKAQTDLMEQEIADAPAKRAAELEELRRKREAHQIAINKDAREAFNFTEEQRTAANERLEPVFDKYRDHGDVGQLQEEIILALKQSPENIRDAFMDNYFGADKVLDAEEATKWASLYYKSRDNKYSVLSLDEKIAMGMERSWAENAVVERDKNGNLTINNRPTGLTAEDLNARGAVSETHLSKSTVEFQDATIGAASAAYTGAELVKISSTNPESIGNPGAFMQWGGNLVHGTKSLMEWAGMDFADSVKDPIAATVKQSLGSSAFTYNTWDLDKLGVSTSEAAAFQAGVYSIAFASAVAEQGTRPTDKDIQQFIDQIGGRSSSPRAFRRSIVQFMRRQNFRLNLIANVKSIPTNERKVAISSWNESFDLFMEAYAESEHFGIAEDPEGNRWINMTPNQNKDGWEIYREGIN